MDLEEQYDRIFKYLYFRLHDRQTAEDLTQEAFLRFLGSRTYRDENRQMRYLYTIARNLCSEYYRDRVITYSLEETDERAENPEEAVLQKVILRDALEKAGRFSLRSIVLSRMFLVGLVDTAGLLIVMAAVRRCLPYSFFRVFLYMMVPYLAASFLGSLYERKIKTDTIFGSLAICAVSSAVFAAAPFIFQSLYEEQMTIVWAGAFVLLAAGLGAGMRELINETEAAAWN